MTGWTILLRGARHRAGRSLVVLALAVIAVAAAALTPAYARAAQQSVLTDTMRDAPATATALLMGADGDGGGPELDPAVDTQRAVDGLISGYPLLKTLIRRPLTAVETETEIAAGPGAPQGAERILARYAYRDKVCAQVRTTGTCPIEPDQIMVSDRAARTWGWEIGETLTLMMKSAPVKREIVGTYTPIDAAGDYWGITSYFSEMGFVDPETAIARTDAIFAGAEEDIKAWPGFSGTPTSGGAPRISLSLRYTLDLERVNLADVDRLRDELDRLALALVGVDLRLTTSLPSLLDDVAVDREAIADTVPLVAVPLVVLAFFVLMLLVASLAEERGPEIALAKLRGYPAGQAARFGQGEVLALMVLATPLGIAVGLGITELAARFFLAEGTGVELRWEPLAAGAGALIIGFASVWAASRRTVRSGVLSLLRRVPHRATWRSSALEAVAVALAVVAVFAALRERGSLLALLATPMLAVVAGIVIGRVLRTTSAARLAIARRRGNLANMLASAQLSRRSGRYRVVTVMTVAVALLGFAATAWDVAAQARQTRAENAVGAPVVYSVAAPNPRALVDAVRTAVPDGSAMPVVRRVEQYSNGHVEVLGVPANQLSRIVTWRDRGQAELSELAVKLHPAAPDPVPVRGVLRIRVDVTSLGDVPLRIAAMVLEPGHSPRTVTMGQLRRGRHEYSAEVPNGRFAGLSIQRPAASTASASVVLRVLGASSAAGTANISLTDAAAWRFAEERSGGATATLQAGSDGLEIDAGSTSFADINIDYLDTPSALPIVMAGAAPTERPDAAELTFPAFAELPQRFTIIENAAYLPRAGDHAMLVDLDYALRMAEGTSGFAEGSALFYEVWATGGAGDLRARLAEAGVRVVRAETVTGYADRLGRRAPALSLRLYLLAAAVAVALALGVILFVTRIGADARRLEMAALRVAGVGPKVLRRGLRREYLSLLGLPVIAGFLVGVGSAWLMLPGIPLVTVGELSGPRWTPAFGALAIAAGASLLSLLVAIVVAVRLLRRATPDLLRGEL